MKKKEISDIEQNRFYLFKFNRNTLLFTKKMTELKYTSISIKLYSCYKSIYNYITEFQTENGDKSHR